MVRWELVYRPCQEGGLGLGNLVFSNMFLDGKLLWVPFETKFSLALGDQNTFWSQTGRDATPTVSYSSPKNHFSRVHFLHSLARFRVVVGARIHFWEVVWVSIVIPGWLSSLFLYMKKKLSYVHNQLI